MIKIYKGKLITSDYGESDDQLFLEGTDEPLVKILQQDIEEHGHYLTIRYFVMDKDLPIQEIEEYYFKQLIGKGEANWCACYSEITGYLYTDVDLVVGSHNLLNELESSAGKYIMLEIEYMKEK